jgi:exosortase/archaeosortase family protein
MKLSDVISRKSWIIIAIVILVILIYFILQFYIFHSDPVIRLLESGINSYLLLIEKLSNLFIKWIGSGVKIDNHRILLNNETVFIIESGVLMKKWIVILLLLFWLTKTSIKQKILFTTILLGSSLIAATLTITITAFLSETKFEIDSANSISRTLGVIMMIFICQIWIMKHKTFIITMLSKLHINTDLINSKISSLFIVMYIYAFASNFIYGYFYFGLWIDFLFNAAQRILAVLGVEAVVEPNYLIGNNGTLYMARACLGFKTMLLFASIVFLTGIKNIRRWSFIIAGVVFLNFVNIIRFVFLFLHVQKYGDYQLKIDVHDMYTYITYVIVFILWVIWFEFFTDVKIIHIPDKNSR